MPAYPRNDPCPCDSGKKYKACCARKGIVFTISGDEVSRRVPVKRPVSEVIARQRERFIARFGRAPGPDDPIFFKDAPGDTPQPLDEADFKDYVNEVAKAMEAVGLDDALIYAFRKTGVMVTTENMKLLPDRDVQAFTDAVDEFRALFPKKKDSTKKGGKSRRVR